MSPPLRQTTRRYEAALRLSPPVRATIGWPVAFPRGGGLHGLGDSFWTDLFTSAAAPVAGAVQAQAAELKNALRLIIGLSAVAAVTGVIAVVRR